MRKESLKLTWQDLPKEALQSSLLDSAGMHPDSKKPWSSFSCLFCFFRLLSGLQICVTSCVRGTNKVNSEFFKFCFVFRESRLPSKEDTWIPVRHLVSKPAVHSCSFHLSFSLFAETMKWSRTKRVELKKKKWAPSAKLFSALCKTQINGKINQA